MQPSPDIIKYALDQIDRQLDGIMPESQFLGILVGEASLGSPTARLLLLAYQHQLHAIDEAERFVREHGSIVG